MMPKIRKDQDKEAGTVTYGKMSEMTAGEMTEASLLGKRGGVGIRTLSVSGVGDMGEGMEAHTRKAWRRPSSAAFDDL